MLKSNYNDPRISTIDSKGVPYNERLGRVRESLGLSREDVAKLLEIPFPEYDEWESHAGELSRVMSLAELSKVASVLRVPTSAFFEDRDEKVPQFLPCSWLQ